MVAIVRPNRGLWFDQPLIAVPDAAFAAGHNFRIQNGKANNLNLGWAQHEDYQLGITLAAFDGDPVTLIYGYFDRDSVQTLVYGSPRFLFKRVDEDTLEFLNLRYVTGTVAVTNGSADVVGTGTTWTGNLTAGDYIFVGANDENDPLASRWYEIEEVTGNTTLTLAETYAGLTASGQNYTGLKSFTGDLDTPWEGITFLHEAQADEDLLILTNGVDDIVTWNGSDPTVTDAGLGFTAFHLGLFKNMVIYMAITESGEFFPAELRNSDVGDPLNVSTGLASAFTVHEGSDEVSAAIGLGDSLVVYSERHINVCDFVGDPFVFVIRTGVPNIGPISSRLVGDFGDRHAFIGPDAQYEFDGVVVRATGNQAFRAVLRQRDPTRTFRAFSHFDEENGDLIWVIPLTDDGTEAPAKAFVDHYLEETPDDIVPVSSRDFPFTASGFHERQENLGWDDISDTFADLNFRFNDIFFNAAFPFNLVGDADGFIYTLGTAQTAAGEDMTSFVRTGRRPTAEGRRRDIIARIYPFASEFAERELQVRTRLSDSAAGPVYAIDEVDFDTTLEREGHFATIYRAARYYELEFGTTGDAWELSGWDVETRPGGYR